MAAHGDGTTRLAQVTRVAEEMLNVADALKARRELLPDSPAYAQISEVTLKGWARTLLAAPVQETAAPETTTYQECGHCGSRVKFHDPLCPHADEPWPTTATVEPPAEAEPTCATCGHKQSVIETKGHGPACWGTPEELAPPLSPLLALADSIARRAHDGQQCTVTGEPYMRHVERVAERVDGEDAKAVALLHDVVEDSSITARDLADAGIPGRVVEAVELLTRRQPYDYAEYIDQIAKSGNALAVAVKLADLRDHLTPACPERLRPRYERALAELDVVGRPDPATPRSQGTDLRGGPDADPAPALEWQGPDEDGDVIVSLIGVEGWHIAGHGKTHREALAVLGEAMHMAHGCCPPAAPTLRAQIEALPPYGIGFKRSPIGTTTPTMLQAWSGEWIRRDAVLALLPAPEQPEGGQQ